MTNVICVCGEEAPIVLITEQEPDKEIREYYFGKRIVRCENCMTLTLVAGELQKMLDDAERIGELGGCAAPMVSLLKEKANPMKSKVTVHGKNEKEVTGC